jgi:aminomethyltransferase
MLKKTCLNSLHVASGAKMVDFGGWEMPLHYGSQIEEHHRVRQEAGVFDVSHMLVIDIDGAAAKDYLRRVLANNVAKLSSPGAALYSCMLNEAGGVIDDLIVYRTGEQSFRLVVNAGAADKDLAWLGAQRNQSNSPLTINPRRDLAMLAVQGPSARARVWQALPGSASVSEALKPFYAAEFGDYFIARTGYTGEDGFEIVLPAARAIPLWQALIDNAVSPVGLGARDTLRLEAGMCLYGQDMDETVSPYECGLRWSVDSGAGRDFIGKAALLGASSQRHSIGLVLLDKGVMRSHQKILTSAGEGEITSGTFAPTLNRSIALARIPGKVQAGEVIQVQVRDKALRARVTRPPFVRHGKILIEELQ